MTQAELTALINAKIRNKTPKVIKTEHADVEQEITDTLFDNVALLSFFIGSMNDTIADIQAVLPRNSGVVKSINIGSGTVGASSATQGTILSCILNAVGSNGNTYTVTLTNAMPTTSYSVFFTLESKSGDMFVDNNALSVVFKPLTTTTFQFSIDDNEARPSDLIDLHIKVYNNNY